MSGWLSLICVAAVVLAAVYLLFVILHPERF
ncbi:MAG: potassium-transporting ATPase subunit F [Luteimonas sp.]|nr:potassium-transporting ATPase subunit F [Luteimonas sp.]